ncbi:hypothetical protein BDF20DRAFT_910008 [Mycotypha africana]|uniref:uncharacterized protein n=1 Tax=Mycotypha africana TaxID=64632 RepID=UPI00230109A7|nr:uncharacterized protein BDF20DRAFT_910008 [Mycotypha africana]KAI8987378.1 hypothetical protein BDF20DRAFT_910008 [Mycotypha africana]
MNFREADNIARQITQKWLTLLKSHVKQSSDVRVRSFLHQLEKNGSIAFKHDDQRLMDRALDCIPLQRLYEEAENELNEQDREGSLEDAVIRRLLYWFKNEFFSWVNNAPCDYCRSEQTQSIGHTQPNSDDMKYGAHVVELYMCSSCNNTTRFPRYNDPGKLLETRRGRCGEWANCFTLCCRAVGAEARIVYDTTDHVWTEVYSDFEKRWVHCDSCEEAWDKPLLYSVGWNKQLSYCTAFSAVEAVDVTKRYTRNWPEVLKRRNRVREIELNLFLHTLTEERQKNLSSEQKDALNERRVQELKELEETSKRAIIKKDEMIGRHSVLKGSLAWRTKRGETGTTAIAQTENWMATLDITALKLSRLFIRRDVEVRLLGDSSILTTEGVADATENQMIRLTKAVPDQRGAAFCKHPIPLNDGLEALEVEFKFRITDQNGLPAFNGADGFAFVIQGQSEDALGSGGCELGYGGIQYSLAIEFDTYQSSDRCADPSGNHISIHARNPPLGNSAHHDYSLGHTSRIPSLQNGSWMKALVRLIVNGTIEVGLAENSDDKFIQVLKVTGHNFLDYLLPKEKAWVGFSASTGGLSQAHDIIFTSIKEYRP